ncbi:hypothetical protein LXL04_022930 [Taraxacum kok-saghyz]
MNIYPVTGIVLPIPSQEIMCSRSFVKDIALTILIARICRSYNKDVARARLSTQSNEEEESVREKKSHSLPGDASGFKMRAGEEFNIQDMVESRSALRGVEIEETVIKEAGSTTVIERNKINWVAWKVVLGSKKQGGLGVGSIASMNWALLIKWLWRFKNENTTLWRRVVCGLHNNSRKPVSSLSLKIPSGVWYNSIKSVDILVEVGIDIFSIFDIQVKGGENTLFWTDNWTGCGLLSERFPALFNLEKRKSSFIAERFEDNKFRGYWKRNPSDSDEIRELQDLRGFTDSISLSNGLDIWKSKLSSTGEFLVQHVRNLIDSKVTIPKPNPTVWLKLAPIKVIFFVWRACIDRIPSAVALAGRGIAVPNSSCHLCSNGIDDTNHFLVGCSTTREVLDWILNWCGISLQNVQTVTDLVQYAAMWGNCPKRRKILLAIVYGLLWCTWKARNDAIFNKMRSTPTKIVDNVVTLVFGWVKHRDGYGKLVAAFLLTATTTGAVYAAVRLRRRKNLNSLMPASDSGRVEKFSRYVARQLGFKDETECPELSKLACDFVRSSKGFKDGMYVYFSNEYEVDSLCVKLEEEFERCILAYFAFSWNKTSFMISQVLSEGSEERKLKNMVLTATRKQRFERATKDLKVRRAFSTIVEEMKVIGTNTPKKGDGNGASPEVEGLFADKDRSPVILFMGGGMGAGKSTVLKEILKEGFWSEAATNAVVVEADAFKETDVIYQALASKGHHNDMLQTAELVHQTSIDAASSVLVTALNDRRDVIMDGTLSWEPFVEQTIAMIRDIHKHRYRMGVGYNVLEDGTINENYWEKVDFEEEEEEVKMKKPYRIELVGVVCDPFLAVTRGIRRAIAVKRAVRVNSQLKSHKRFAIAFPKYCNLVDNAKLYCTNAIGVPPKAIEWKGGNSNLKEDNPDRIKSSECLETLKDINDEADSILELYADTKMLTNNDSIWNTLVTIPRRLDLQRDLKVVIERIEKSKLVVNAEDLAKQLCNIWICSFKLYASSVVYERGSTNDRQSHVIGPKTHANCQGNLHATKEGAKSYAQVVGPRLNQLSQFDDYLQLQSGDYIFDQRDEGKVVMVRVKHFSVLSVMSNLCSMQGFSEVDIRYLGEVHEDHEDAHFLNANDLNEEEEDSFDEGPLKDVNVEEKSSLRLRLGQTKKPRENLNVDVRNYETRVECQVAPSENALASPQQSDVGSSQSWIRGDDALGGSFSSIARKHSPKQPSVVEGLDVLIKMGLAIGYNMHGCLQDREEVARRMQDSKCNKHHVNFLAVQETKKKDVNLGLVRAICGKSRFEFVHSDEQGQSRGYSLSKTEPTTQETDQNRRNRTHKTETEGKPLVLATRLGHQNRSRLHYFSRISASSLFLSHIAVHSSPSSVARRTHGKLPASHCTWRTLPSGPPQQQAIDTARDTAATAATVKLVTVLEFNSAKFSQIGHTEPISMEVNEPPIINVDEPPVVDVDDGEDEEVADNKGGGHKVSWVWRHFDQEAVKKGAKKVKCPYCSIMMCANMKKNGTSAMGTHLKNHCPTCPDYDPKHKGDKKKQSLLSFKKIGDSEATSLEVHSFSQEKCRRSLALSSESAFSTGGRVIDATRSSLTHVTAEALICAQDWLRSSPIDIQFKHITAAIEEEAREKLAGIETEELGSSERSCLDEYTGVDTSKEIVIMGDFDEVRNGSERFESVVNVPTAGAFNQFILDSDLVDVPLSGRDFYVVDFVGYKCSNCNCLRRNSTQFVAWSYVSPVFGVEVFRMRYVSSHVRGEATINKPRSDDIPPLLLLHGLQD